MGAVRLDRALPARLAALLLCVGWAAGDKAGGAGPDEPYHWAKRARGSGSHSSTAAAPRVNFSAGPAWVWENPDDDLIRASPLIDAQSNVYIAAQSGSILKFDSGGKPLWTWRTTDEEGGLVLAPMLHKGNVYLVTKGGAKSHLGAGYVFAISMESGKPTLRAKVPSAFRWTGDTGSIIVHGGVIVLPSATDTESGHANDGILPVVKLMGLDASNGALLWEYSFGPGLGGPLRVERFMPSLFGEDSILFATTYMKARRLNIKTGKIIWSTDVPEEDPHCRSTGGGSLGPNGIFYTVGSICGDWEKAKLPLGLEGCNFVTYCPGGPGAIVGMKATDGTVVFTRRLEGKPNQVPAIGAIGDRMAVVVSLGAPPAHPINWWHQWSTWMPGSVRHWLFEAHAQYPLLRDLMGITPVLQGSTVAFDAATGEELWTVHDEPNNMFGPPGSTRRGTPGL